MSDRIFEKHPRAYEVVEEHKLIEKLKELRGNPEVDLAIKLLVIKGYAFDKEFSTYEISSLLGVSQTSVTRWVKIWNEIGIEGLKSKTLLMKRERELDVICNERKKKKVEEK